MTPILLACASGKFRVAALLNSSCPSRFGAFVGLTREEAEKLIAALPEHLAAMVRLSLETGLRKSNVTGLMWSQVDLKGRKAWIHPDEAKARKAIAVPLSAAAAAVLKEQLAQKRKEQYRDFVFVYRGKPVTQVNGKAWKGALKRAGIEDFR